MGVPSGIITYISDLNSVKIVNKLDVGISQIIL
nr:MAG TPA: hypothetical protein [Bacteriophage sp.]